MIAAGTATAMSLTGMSRTSDASAEQTAQAHPESRRKAAGQHCEHAGRFEQLDQECRITGRDLAIVAHLGSLNEWCAIPSVVSCIPRFSIEPSLSARNGDRREGGEATRLDAGLNLPISVKPRVLRSSTGRHCSIDNPATPWPRRPIFEQGHREASYFYIDFVI